MPKRLPNGLAWTLLGLTVVLLAANVVLGLTGGESWTAVFGFIPATLSFALVAELLGVVDSAVQPVHLSVWTAEPRQGGGDLR